MYTKKVLGMLRLGADVSRRGNRPESEDLTSNAEFGTESFPIETDRSGMFVQPWMRDYPAFPQERDDRHVAASIVFSLAPVVNRSSMA